MGPGRTHDPCISNRTHYRLLYRTKLIGVPILFKSINSVFKFFDCFGAILYELLIAGLIDLVYQSGANETIYGNRKCLKANLEGTEEEANLFQRKKETCTHPPSPLRGLCISLRRQNTTKVMAYYITRNLPL